MGEEGLEEDRCPGCGRLMADVPVGHCYALPFNGGTAACMDVTPISPEEFLRGVR